MIKILFGIGLGWIIFTYADVILPVAEDLKDKACETQEMIDQLKEEL